jgi:hypothetical protein
LILSFAGPREAQNSRPTAGYCDLCPPNSCSTSQEKQKIFYSQILLELLCDLLSTFAPALTFQDSVIGLDSCRCVPGCWRFIAGLEEASATAPSKYKPCMPCKTGKYRSGNPLLNCTGITQRCPCAAASAETEQGKISVTSSQYGNQQKCEWIIQGGSGITLRINMVDTEDKYDFLSVYGCTSPSCHMLQELAVFSGSHSPIAGEADYLWAQLPQAGLHDRCYRSRQGI